MFLTIFQRKRGHQTLDFLLAGMEKNTINDRGLHGLFYWHFEFIRFFQKSNM